jgi:hypothetical protein
MPQLTLISETFFDKNYFKNNIFGKRVIRIYIKEFGRKETPRQKTSLRPTRIRLQKSPVLHSNMAYLSATWKVFSRLVGRHETAHCHAQHLLFPDGFSYFISFIFIISSLRFVCDGVTMSLLHTYQHRKLLHGIPAFMGV